MAVAVPRAVGGSSAVGRWRDFDWVLLLTTLLLISFGMVVISSTSDDQASLLGAYAVRQMVFALAGLAVMVGLTLLNYRLLASLALPLYIVTIVSLIAVERFGAVIGGSARWFDLKIFLLQPSMIAQLTLVLAFAALLARWGDRVGRPFLSLIHI